MGKGDRKTRKGKLFMGSYGVSRPRKKKETLPPEQKAARATKKGSS